MFDVGFWELMILFTVALLVLGPERLPQVTASIGRWVGRARAMASNLKDQIEEEVELKELEKLHSMDKEFDLSSLDESTEKPEAEDPDAESDTGEQQEETPKASEEKTKTHHEA